MAQDIYQGMFGPRPEDMEQLYTQEYTRGPIAGGKDTVEGVIGQMAGRSARNLLGGLGMEDPRMQEAKATQQAIMEVRDSGVNPSDPVAYYKALAQAFSKYGLADKAAMAADKANSAEDKDLDRKVKYDALAQRKELLLAKAGTKPGRERLDLLIKENFKDATIESKKEAFKVFNETGDVDSALKVLVNEKEGLKSKIETMVVNDKKVLVLVTRDKNGEIVDTKTIAGDSPNVSASVGGITVGDKAGGAAMNIFNDGQKAFKEIDADLTAVDKAITSLNANSPLGESFATMTLARLVQTGNLSEKDITRVDNTGSAPRRFFDTVKKWTTGQVTETTVEDRRLVLRVLKEYLKTKRTEKAAELRQLLIDAQAGRSVNPDIAVPAYKDPFDKPTGVMTPEQRKRFEELTK